MLDHTVRFGVQRVAGVAQQIHDAGVHHIHLFWLKVFLFIVEEGGEVDGWHWRGWGNPLPSALGDEVALSVSVAAVVHGKLQYAFHEDCAVPHAGPIQRPQVYVMGVGAHDNVMECLVESQIWVAIQRIQVVFVVIHGSIQPGQASKLDFDDGMEAAK